MSHKIAVFLTCSLLVLAGCSRAGSSKPQIAFITNNAADFWTIARKGVDVIARSFVRLALDVSNVRLRIVGEGELRESLVRTLRPVSERVEFVGFKDWGELPAEYAAADVLCVPSRYDGWGLVVPEGLAAGLPVIGTDRMGAALEFVKTGRNGWLIRAGDEEALLEAMREAASVPLSEMSCRARESVSEHTLRNGAIRFVDYSRHVIQKTL